MNTSEPREPIKLFRSQDDAHRFALDVGGYARQTRVGSDIDWYGVYLPDEDDILF